MDKSLHGSNMDWKTWKQFNLQLNVNCQHNSGECLETSFSINIAQSNLSNAKLKLLIERQIFVWIELCWMNLLQS